jgi:phage shock protein E
MFMQNPIPSLKRLGQLLVAAGCVTCASAADTNVIHVNPEQAQKLIAKKKIVVLDIRTPEEFAAGHIAGATNINFRAPEFAKAIAGLDPKQTCLLYCASGNRSTQALPAFQELQFQSLYHLDGGIKGWEKAGLPVAK